MKITEIAIKRPILVIVFFTFLIIVGVISYFGLNYELMPKITPPYISVATVYPGAAPSEVENSVSKPIEDAVSNIEDIKTIWTNSYENLSLIMIEFDINANEDRALVEVQRKVNGMLSQLPAGVKTPELSRFSLSELPVLYLGVRSNLSPREFRYLLKDQIIPRMAQKKGVGQVNIVGGEEAEIRIELNSEKLKEYKLSTMQVVDAIKAANNDMPAGKIQSLERETGVRVIGKFEKIEPLSNLVVGKSQDGSPVKLNAVANVFMGHKDPDNISRLNLNDAVGLLVMKQNEANTVMVSENVRAAIKELENDYKNYDLKFFVAQDASTFTLDAAHDVNKDLLIAITLVAFVMLVFLHSLRNSLIVLVAIPTSLISTFVIMSIFNFSLNLMTLLAMSLVIGILVDDSIVVLENIHRHLSMGKDKKKASLDGRNEIGFSALAITLIDIVVYIPLALVSGMIGNILRQFAVMIAASTLMSLLVSFTITPMLASRFGKLEDYGDSLMGRFAKWFERKFDSVVNAYSGALAWALSHKTVVIISTLVLFIGSLGLLGAGVVGSEFISSSDRSQVSVVVELVKGTTLYSTDEVVKQLEEKISKIPEVKTIFTNVGASSEGFLNESAANSAELTVTLVPKEERVKSASVISEEIKAITTSFPGIKSRISPIGLFGTANDAPVQLIISGADRDSVLAYTNKLAGVLKNIKGTDDVRLSIKEGAPETKVVIDHQKVADLNLSVQEVAYALRLGLTGDDDSKFRTPQRDYPLRILFDKQSRSNTEDLGGMSFISRTGGQIQLKQVASLQSSFAPSKLERVKRNNSIMLMANVIDRPSGDIGQDITKYLEANPVPKGISVAFEGDLKMQDESFIKLLYAFMAAIVFVYLVMVALYNSFVYPFIVLFSIPVSIVGAIGMLAITGQSLNIFSILGMIILIGLVGKNAVLLVDRTNAAREEGMNLYDALIDAGRKRIRPILMTDFTIVLGMLPIALATGAGAEWKNGLAWAIIGGKISSLFLTLFLVPVIYWNVDRLKERLMKRFNFSFGKNGSGGKTALTAIALAVVLLSSTVKAQTVKLSLNDAVQYGLNNNKELKISTLEIEKSDKKIKEAFGNYLPSVSATGQYVRNTKLPVVYFPDVIVDPNTFEFKFGSVKPIVAAEENMYTGSVTLTMPVYRRDVIAGYELAEAEKRITETSREYTKQTLVSDIKKNYYSILFAQEQYEYIRQSIERLEISLNEARSLYLKGMLNQVDTLQIYSAYENLKPALINAKNQIHQLKASLKILTGLDYNAEVTVTDSLNGFSLMNKYESLEASDELVANNLSFRQTELLLDVAGKQVKFENSGFYPNLSLTGQVQIQSQAGDFKFKDYNWATNSYVGLQLDIPLFSGFKTRAKVEQAEIAREQSRLQLDNTRQQLKTKITQIVLVLTEVKEKISAQKIAVDVSERSYKNIKSRWGQGLQKNSDLTEANLVMSESKTKLASAVLEYLITRTDLENLLNLND
jgi:hydrophobe/amphiphile efflux-1 (HAE1) family protein